MAPSSMMLLLVVFEHCSGVTATLLNRYTTMDLYTLPEDSCVKSIQGRDWDNIRIHVEYVDYGNTQSTVRRSTVAVLQDRVIPHVARFWHNAMKVRRVSTPLTFAPDCVHQGAPCPVTPKPSICRSDDMEIRIPPKFLSGYTASNQKTKVPGGAGVAADLVLLVAVSRRDGCIGPDESSGDLASAFTCRVDDCGRPILGVVHVCPPSLKGPQAERTLMNLSATISHELTHVFGFSSNIFAYMRYPNGAPRVPAAQRKQVYYTCEMRNGKPEIHWDVSLKDPLVKKLGYYAYTFAPGIIKQISSTRGGVGESCRCPLNPRRAYTNADIEHCLSHRYECALAVVTPTVKKMTQHFFNCPDVIGAELENQQFSSSTCGIINSHWKTRLFKGEYMMATQDDSIQYVSPITFAFLDDTGWYQMNYKSTSTLVPGATWGYKAGCSFVNEKCINDEGTPLTSIDSKMFCTRDVSIKQISPVCSADGMHKTFCGAMAPGSGISPPAIHKYPVNGFSVHLDYCPAFTNFSSGGCMEPSRDSPYDYRDIMGKSSRCLDIVSGVTQRRQGICMSIECDVTGSMYWVTTSLTHPQKIAQPCTTVGQQIRIDSRSNLICHDPQVICQVYSYPHIADHPLYSVDSAALDDSSRREAASVAKNVDQQSPAIIPSSDRIPARLPYGQDDIKSSYTNSVIVPVATALLLVLI